MVLLPHYLVIRNADSSGIERPRMQRGGELAQKARKGRIWETGTRVFFYAAATFAPIKLW